MPGNGRATADLHGPIGMHQVTDSQNVVCAFRGIDDPSSSTTRKIEKKVTRPSRGTPSRPVEDLRMSARRHRSAVACQHCRQRKVRCSLTVTGVPCVGCAQDQTECVVDRKKRQTPQRPRPASGAYYSPQSTPNEPEECHVELHASSPSNANSRFQPLAPRLAQVGSTENEQRGRGSSIHRDRASIQEEERNAMEIATAAFEPPPQRAGQILFYPGEETGVTSVLEVCVPRQSMPRHLLVPSCNSIPLSDEDRNYLRVKGVYTLPSREACASLLHAYLHHVHPIIPVVDVSIILHYHQAGRLHEYNILLLWSVFFAAVHFIPGHIWQQEGYRSRKEMKAIAYSRAKIIYSIGHETDKIVQLQSSLLLGFWHSDMDEMTQPWYWTGIAINLCQMLGLHRDPDSAKYNPSITDHQRRLWRRLWWSCLFRDRWLSVTLGRPLRIDLKDCDTPMPSAADILDDISPIPNSISAAYLPNDLPQLAEYWVILVELSKLLGAVLTMNYQLQGPNPTLHQVEALESQILQCKIPDQYQPGLSRLAVFYLYHLQLHYQALLSIFYRPYGTKVPDGLHLIHQKDWQHRMRLKIESAASQTNSILDVLAQDKLLEFAGPMTPPLLIPAMRTHLLNCKSTDTLSRRLGLNKLNVCMMVLEELQETYTVASIYRGIFSKAIKQICPDEVANTASPNPIPNPVSVESDPAEAIFPDGPVMDTYMCDDIINALLDEASVLNF